MGTWVSLVEPDPQPTTKEGPRVWGQAILIMFVKDVWCKCDQQWIS